MNLRNTMNMQNFLPFQIFVHKFSKQTKRKTNVQIHKSKRFKSPFSVVLNGKSNHIQLADCENSCVRPCIQARFIIGNRDIPPQSSVYINYNIHSIYTTLTNTEYHIYNTMPMHPHFK